jgi:outer membrane scaffolding protein for murein synthesis (MipA/OmpV family)
MNFPKYSARRRLAVALLSAAPLQAAWSDEPDGPPGADGRHWGIGLGGGIQTQPYAGVDRKAQALPILFFENRYVRVIGPGVDLKLPDAGPVSFALRARYSGEGYAEDDSPLLAGMGSRHGGVWLGASARWHNDIAQVFSEVSGDASGHSKGLQARVGIEKAFRFGRFNLTPSLSATWYDSKYVDYYYGVTSAEALATRAQYDGRATVNTELSLRSRYMLSPQSAITLDVGVTRLGSGIRGSSLVDRSSTAKVGMGYLYRF